MSSGALSTGAEPATLPISPTQPHQPAKSKSKLALEWAAWGWLLGPILLRLLIMPLNHAWDVQTWYDFFADFKFNRTPYETMRTLTFESSLNPAQLNYYEYYAYPPGLIYIYWPLAKFYSLLDPNLNYHVSAPLTIAFFPVPMLFNYFFKIPIMLADVGIIVLLQKIAGREIAKRYAWNHYVLLVMIWMFDPMMAFCILWGVYALERDKLKQAGLAFALGTVLKYVPMFLIPAILLYLFRQKYPLPRIGMFILVYGLTCAVLVAPFLDGTLFVLGFQTSRAGDGLSWHAMFSAIRDLSDNPGIQAISTFASVFLGQLVLPIGMMLVYVYTYRRQLTLNSTVLVTMLGYIACTKIVNEVYALPLLPLILLELQRHPSKIKERYYKLCWSIPLGWAVVGVPFFIFFTMPLIGLGQIDVISTYELETVIERKDFALLFGVVGLGYTLLCLFAMSRFAVSLKAAKIKNTD
jgi:hypothetical protein